MMLIEKEERITDGENGSGTHVDGMSAAIVTCPTALRRILQPNIGLVAWERDLADDVAQELANLTLDAVDDFVFVSETDALEEDLAAAMVEAGYPDMPAFRRDVAMLARQHGAITGDMGVRIRLEVVETDACRKFHADYVKARTITTYLGQGTQWIDARSAERAGCPGAPEISQLGMADVGIFKGRLWQERPTILHRSPPIGGSGEQRLVLAIDPPPGKDEISIRLGGKSA